MIRAFFAALWRDIQDYPKAVMQIYDQLTSDMKDAMRSGKKGRLNTIRSLRAAIQKAQIDSGSRDESPDDSFVMGILQKQAKMRREALDQYKSAERADLAEIEENELAVIEEYLPAQLDDTAIRAEVQKILDGIGEVGPGDFGKVMGPSMKALKGRADGKRVQAVVRELLNS